MFVNVLRTIKHFRRRKASRSVFYCNAEAAGFEPANRLRAVNCFRGSLLQPLGHASLKYPLRHQIPENALQLARTQITMRPDDSIVISFWTGKFNATARITQVFVNQNSQKLIIRNYGIFTAFTSFSARSRNARPSGRDDNAAGSPASPFSRILWTIGIWPRSGTPYFSAILTPPSFPKI